MVNEKGIDMKARLVKKIMKAYRGGQTSKLSPYWYRRVVLHGIMYHDHRVSAAYDRTMTPLPF
jgi:hypothetical protein